MGESAIGDVRQDGALFQAGDFFRGYVIEKPIGEGGLGMVYLVRHRVLDTPFALKILNPKVAAQKPEYVKRFVREAKLASKIRHPNLVTVHDAGHDEDRGIYYLVMDYVQGSTLRQAIALGGGMTDKEAVRIISCVASALDAAQGFGLVHRDIKPENIMLMQDGTVKLIDLGVAKATRAIDSLKTMEKTVFGTPAYMSPEQAMDSSSVDVRSDIYSLGVVFFEMLCGRSPYRGRATEKIVQELLAPRAIPDVRAFNASVSPKISAVIKLMCAKKVEERIKTPAELLETFSRLGYDVPALARVSLPDTSDDHRPFSYQVAADGASRTLSFKTDDTEIQGFVDRLKRRRFRRNLLLALVALAVSVGVVVAGVLLLVR